MERTPDAVAVCCDQQSLTYRELNEQANRLAHYLQKRGIGPGNLIGIYLERSLAMMVALLAVQKSGAAYVPIDPAYPADRIGFMLEDAQAPLLLTEKSLLDSVPPHAGEALCLDSDAARWAEESVTNPSSQVTPEDLVYVIFTSGSTGRPKGVQVRHRAVVNLLSCMVRELDMGEHDVVPALDDLRLIDRSAIVEMGHPTGALEASERLTSHIGSVDSLESPKSYTVVRWC